MNRVGKWSLITTVWMVMIALTPIQGQATESYWECSSMGCCTSHYFGELSKLRQMCTVYRNVYGQDGVDIVNNSKCGHIIQFMTCYIREYFNEAGEVPDDLLWILSDYKTASSVIGEHWCYEWINTAPVC